MPLHQFGLRPDQVFFNNEELDFAIVAVGPVSLDQRTRVYYDADQA